MMSDVSPLSRTLAGVAAFASLAFASDARVADLSGVWWVIDRSEIAKVDHDRLPLTAAAAEQYQTNRAAVAAGKDVPPGLNACIPEGMPRLMLARLPFEIFQKPEQVTILHERKHVFRMIPITKAHREDPDASYNGTSIGRWDGDTLVVDTIAINASSVVDRTGIPHSDAMRLRERFSLRDDGKVLRDEITVDDPKTFTGAWSFTVDYARHPDVRLMDDVCQYGPPARDQLSNKK
jgi:hypothetical protein